MYFLKAPNCTKNAQKFIFFTEKIHSGHSLDNFMLLSNKPVFSENVKHTVMHASEQ